MAAAGFLFLLVLLGQDSLHHVANFGDVGQIYFRCNRLRGPRSRSAVGGGMGSVLKMRANLIGFVILNRAGVGFDSGDAELRENVDNCARLDFQLARKIVDSNLTHPPLFEKCCPKPLVAHSYLSAMVCGTSIIA